MVTLIFEPHATTIDNENEVASGHYDVDLSAHGMQQALDMGVRYKNTAFDAVFTSDLKRASRTAEIAFQGRDVPLIKDPRLRECDYGGWTRRSKSEVEAERVHRIQVPFPQGESYAQTTERMKQFLQDLLAHYDGKKVLIIGHRATHYALDHVIRRIPLEQALAAHWHWQPGWTYALHEINFNMPSHTTSKRETNLM